MPEPSPATGRDPRVDPKAGDVWLLTDGCVCLLREYIPKKGRRGLGGYSKWVRVGPMYNADCAMVDTDEWFELIENAEVLHVG